MNKDNLNHGQDPDLHMANSSANKNLFFREKWIIVVFAFTTLIWIALATYTTSQVQSNRDSILRFNSNLNIFLDLVEKNYHELKLQQSDLLFSLSSQFNSIDKRLGETVRSSKDQIKMIDGIIERSHEITATATIQLELLESLIETNREVTKTSIAQQNTISHLLYAFNETFNQSFPHTERLLHAFRTLSFEEGTRLAENLIFAYPSDYTALLSFTNTYKYTVNQLILDRELITASGLISWLEGIHDRQAMVAKGYQSMDVYLSAVTINRSLREDLLQTANLVLNQSRDSIRQATDFNLQTLNATGTTIALTASFLGDDSLANEATNFINSLELLSLRPEGVGPLHDLLLNYLEETIPELQFNDDLDPAVKDRLVPRVFSASDELAALLRSIKVSTPVLNWVENELVAMGFILSTEFVAPTLSDSWEDLIYRLIQDLERAGNSLVWERAKSSTASLELDRNLLEISRQLSILDPQGQSLARIAVKQREIELAASEEKFDSAVSRIRNHIQTDNLSDEKMDLAMLWLSLLPEPVSEAQMGSLLNLTAEVHRLQQQREEKRIEKQIMFYNRWALIRLDTALGKIKSAHRRDSDSVKINAAKLLAEIQVSLLNRAMSDYFADVYAEAMKGLKEEQKLEVYRHWANTSPRRLNSINNTQ